MSLPMDENWRVLRFDGVHNFRDSGGYPVAGGGKVRTGRLLRSAQHRDATAEDLERIGRLGLAAVVDLRGDGERRRWPCPRPQGFAAQVLFAPDGEAPAQAEAAHVEAARGVVDPASAAERMRAAYAMLPFRSTFLEAMNHYFTALARAEGPVLIHCMAGKDRTGIAVAVLHRVLGVEREHWLADYLLTNVAGNIEGRVASGGRDVRAAFGEIDDATLRVLMSVRPEFIDNAFAEMDARHGSLAGYLASCGIDEALVGRVRERLIV